MNDVSFQIWRKGEKYERDGYIYWNPNGWTIEKDYGALLQWFKHTSLIRYIQVWGKVNADRFCRAFKGTEKLRRSFNGMIGSNNNRGVLYKDSDRFWHTNQLEKIYPEVKLLPKEGVKKAKEIACAYKNEQSQLTTK